MSPDRQWLSLLLTACVLACPSPSQNDEGQDEASGSTDSTGGELELWDLYAEAECAAYAECGCTAPMGLGADLDACIEMRRTALGAIAEGGTVQWDPDCAQARLELIATSCELGQAECPGQQCSLFVGSGDAGGACTIVGDSFGRADAAECMAGLACRSGACAGHDCGPLSCEAGGGYCPPGTQCFCVDLGACACAADVAEGQACDDNFGPACMAGLVCDEGACAMPGQPGQPCVAGTCVSGNYCDGTDTCMAQGDPGDPCGAIQECLSYACDGTCSDFAGEGEACSPGPLCAEGLQCLLVDEMGNFGCHSSKQPGEACVANGQCQGGSACVEGICQSGLCAGL